MLEIDALYVQYPDGTKAVNNTTFRLDDHERAALVGPNGAGKSTLMLAVAGAVALAGGRVVVDGVAVGKKADRALRGKVGLVFQNPDDQLFMPTILDDVAFGPRNMGLTDADARAADALERLGIAHLARKQAAALSGGEKRLAAIATVLSMAPSVLLFDEPTAFLDLRARRNLIQLLRGLPHAQLIASHDLPFLREVCATAALMKDGCITQTGDAQILLSDEAAIEDL